MITASDASDLRAGRVVSHLDAGAWGFAYVAHSDTKALISRGPSSTSALVRAAAAYDASSRAIRGAGVGSEIND